MSRPTYIAHIDLSPEALREIAFNHIDATGIREEWVVWIENASDDRLRDVGHEIVDAIWPTLRDQLEAICSGG